MKVEFKIEARSPKQRDYEHSTEKRGALKDVNANRQL